MDRHLHVYKSDTIGLLTIRGQFDGYYSWKLKDHDRALVPQRTQSYPRNHGYEPVNIPNDFKSRPPAFNGKPKAWEPFLMQLRLSYGWSDRKFREQLMFALRGEALLFASNLPHITAENTESLLQAMEQRFGQCLLAETHRANLYNLKKQTKGNLQQYSARVNRLMSRAYPGMQGTAVFENLAIEHLLRGLPDQKLAYEILTKKPKDLSDTINMITWHEACHQFTCASSKEDKRTQNENCARSMSKTDGQSNYGVRHFTEINSELHNTCTEECSPQFVFKSNVAGKSYVKIQKQWETDKTTK